MRPSNKLMKRLSLYLFLLLFTLQTSSWADDIQDFQIEGMSVGDSLLDYLTEEEIKNEQKYIYENNKFIAILISKPSFELYEDVQIVYESSNKKIHSLEALIDYKKNIKDCYNKKDEIVSELTEFFENKVKIWRQNNKKYTDDKSGKSKFQTTHLNFKTGGSFKFTCYDWSEELTDTKGWIDSLSISINSEKTTLKKVERNFWKWSPQLLWG